MKKLNILKSTLASLSLAFLASCSTSQYTFAPGTGSYHETIAKKQTEEQKAEPLALADASEEVKINNSEVEIISSPKAEATSALAQTLATNKKIATEASVSTDTKADKKATRQALKQAKAKLKKIKKDIKDGKGEQGLGLNNNVKLLLILGLAFILVGALLGVGIIYTIGAILLIIGLVLLLMEIL